MIIIGTMNTDYVPKTNVATFPILSSNNSVTIPLNSYTLTKSSSISLEKLLPKSFLRPLNS